MIETPVTGPIRLSLRTGGPHLRPARFYLTLFDQKANQTGLKAYMSA